MDSRWGKFQMEADAQGRVTSKTLTLSLVLPLGNQSRIRSWFFCIVLLNDLTSLHLFNFSYTVFPTRLENPQSPGTLVYSLLSQVLSTMPFS